MNRLATACLAGLVAAAVVTPASAQDAAAGEKVFKKCTACHAVGEKAKNKTGPVLNGVVGGAAGQAEGFKYSQALRDAGLTWVEANLVAYLKNPKGFLKGTKMTFAGLKDDAEIADVIAYMAQFKADGSTN